MPVELSAESDVRLDSTEEGEIDRVSGNLVLRLEAKGTVGVGGVAGRCDGGGVRDREEAEEEREAVGDGKEGSMLRVRRPSE